MMSCIPHNSSGSMGDPLLFEDLLTPRSANGCFA
jgi:hypothetical protein